jgi:hypothetical protein
LGRTADAARWLDALAATHPESVTAQKALLDFAQRRADAGRTTQAKAALARLRTQTGELDARPIPGPISVEELERALPASDLDGARALARRAHMSPAGLALHLVALGRSKLASEQANWVLLADPTNTDAWIAALVAADFDRDETAFAMTLSRLESGTRPSPLGARLLAELMARRADADAAEHWLALYGPSPTGKERLEGRD